ncbi:hypothetical protein HU200_035862 [Digitaria exilis]|uniref:RNase H type-1 domain-containing protein n=1 Tax=Digitaria exilis TaxID=1010633 RepID=A0A835BT32_9POAL|nr:hypothetical protein HU200_035862 [Digitaria exilis]
MEKTGLFTVRSAYNLALTLKNLDTQQSSSASPSGERKIWSLVWGGKKLCRDALPTRRCKFRRGLQLEDRCPICNGDVETSHHATVVCPPARGLWEAMRQHWPLPDKSKFAYTGRDWLQLLLECSPAPQRDLIKLVLWRAWTMHNNITHQSGPTGILDSVHFLLSMQSTLSEVHQGDTEGTAWTPPEEVWTKLNVDGSFVAQTGQAGVGVVARNSQGKVIFTAWQELTRCSDAAEADANACTNGLRLAVQLSPGKVILETDCVRIARALQAEEECRVVQVKRESNSVANELAQLARRIKQCVVWLDEAPACVAHLLENDFIDTA